MNDERGRRIEEKIDVLSTDIVDMKVLLTKQQGLYEKQQVILEEHTKRSDTLEALYNDIRKNDIEPLKEHVTQVKGVFGFFTALGKLTGLATVIGAALKLAAKFLH
jgi:hypothetical protein